MSKQSSYLSLLFGRLAKLLQRETKKDTPTPQWQNQQRYSNEISLADLIIATHNLPWQNKQQLQQITQSLGFSLQDIEKVVSAEQHSKGIYDHNAYNTRPKPKPKTNKPHLPDTAPPPPKLPIELSEQAQALASELKPRQQQEPASAIPEWLLQDDNGQFPSLLNDTQINPLKRRNLFPDNSSRGILSAALAMQRKGSTLAMDKIINTIVRGQMLKQLPYEISASLEQGCQLLLDYNETMTPYWQDLTSLSQQVENIIGIERVALFEFDNNPLQAKHWLSRKTSKNWQALARKPVLVATNLGQTPDKNTFASNEHWKAFIHTCQQHHAPLLLLIPWQKQHWATDLGSYPIFIHWNPKTSASMVRQLIGKGHKVSP